MKNSEEEQLEQDNFSAEIARIIESLASKATAIKKQPPTMKMSMGINPVIFPVISLCREFA